MSAVKDSAEGTLGAKRSVRAFPLALGQLLRVVVLGLMVGAIATLVLLFIYPPLRAFATPQSYVYSDTQTVALVQWSEHSSTLDGAFHLATVDTSASVIRVHTSAFGGTHDGSNLTLDFADTAIGVPAVSGTLGWRSLQLELPQADGQLAGVRLVPGDLTAYNSGVQALKRAHPGYEIQGN
jgi:hypothetical protein